MRRGLGLLAALAAVLLPLSAAGVQAAPAVPSAATCQGVWVVVDQGPLGGSSTRCATSYGTGSAALTSAGFALTRKGGMICQLNGLPDPCAISVRAYWSYWHAERRPDGSYGPWTYSRLGPDSYHPRRGDAEGWRFGDGKAGPAARPPRAVTATTTPVRTASARPAPATPPPTRLSPTSATPSVVRSTAGPAATPTALATGSPTPAPPTADPQPVAPATGSPAGLIVTGLLLGAGGGGLGAWFLLKGRRR